MSHNQYSSNWGLRMHKYSDVFCMLPTTHKKEQLKCYRHNSLNVLLSQCRAQARQIKLRKGTHKHFICKILKCYTFANKRNLTAS